jgi:iron complex outermembrane receptor protein
LLWAAASRAVRTPSRLDRDLQALPILIPAPNFDAETLNAYEIGYRGELSPSLTLSISAFYNEYDGLRTTSQLPPGAGALAQLQNGMDGHTYGAEIWGQYALADWWRLTGGVTLLRKRLTFKPGVIDLSNMQAAGNDPGRQVQIRSIMTPLPELEFDIGMRVIGALRAAGIPGYTEIDARVGLHINEHLDFNVTAFNLVSPVHAEGGPVNTRRLIRRSINAGFAFKF